MADFCKHCSIEHFGKDFRELAALGPATDETGDPWYYGTICEGCGCICVDVEGQRVTPLDDEDDLARTNRGQFVDEWPRA